MQHANTALFIVEHGEYSDHRVDAVFSTRELAEEFIAKQPENEQCGFSINNRFELDGERNVERVTVWMCRISLKTGQINAENNKLAVEARQAWHKLAVEARQAWLRERGITL